MPKWRRIDVDATWWRRIDVNTTSLRHVLAGWLSYMSTEQIQSGESTLNYLISFSVNGFYSGKFLGKVTQGFLLCVPSNYQFKRN